ncbi:MAG: MBL fold metallo-hydrolase [Oscillospiraceae bacterium]|nr:MBL fold metallo-hydrolase [Oscillospiraceae bacterium]
MPSAPEDRRLKKLERKYRREAARKKRARLLRSYLPYAALLLAAAALAGFLILRRDSGRRTPPPADDLSIYVLDVGQGDAILLRSAGHAALIDAGEYDQGIRIARQIRALGIRKLDYIINSHPHADHIGGMQTVLREIPADTVILPEIADALLPTTPSFLHALDAARECGVPVRTAVCGEKLPLGNAEIELLCTDNAQFEDLNNCSLACAVRYGTFTFFTAGDLEEAGEQAMLQAGLVPQVTVLKVSHHGSTTSTSEAFLAAADPKEAVISVGAGNDYGHPAESTLRRLYGAVGESHHIYRTDLDGNILFTTDGSTCRVQTHCQLDGG